MKTLRQVGTATILTLVLAITVFAGEIDCPGKVSPCLLPQKTETTSTTTDVTTTIIMTTLSLIY